MRSTMAVLAIAWSLPALAQHADPPVVLGTLAGASAQQAPAGVHLYGTDLGWTFEHRGQLIALFGDSWREADTVCSFAANGPPTNDDSQALLPMFPWFSVPTLSFYTKPGETGAFQPIQVLRDGISLNMGLDRTPLTGFSDGEHAIAAFESASFVRCGYDLQAGQTTCPQPFSCEPNLGVCQPAPLDVPQLCDSSNQAGCLEGQLCVADVLGYCVDRTSSQPENFNRVPLEVELSVARADAPTTWDSKHTFVTNKFYNMTARTIRSFGLDGAFADYRPGAGSVLIWGRPGFAGGPGFDTALYLMVHDLPFTLDAAGKLVFQPRYFAGVDRAGKARWSALQQDAVPIALDGGASGATSESVAPVNQMAISWLPAPIHKWLMLYGGGGLGPASALAANGGSVAPGAIALRFADNPWGPWTLPVTHWAPGGPDQPNTPLGAGGVLFHPSCVDAGPLRCTPSDPVRPAHVFTNCAPFGLEMDTGYFYAPNIIDAYTRYNFRGGVDVYWNVSTWNPYHVILVRSSFYPD